LLVYLVTSDFCTFFSCEKHVANNHGQKEVRGFPKSQAAYLSFGSILPFKMVIDALLGVDISSDFLQQNVSPDAG
jgi:hypothetical protein